MYYVYILKSRAKNWYYVGMTDSPTKRLKQHNSGKTQSTKPHRPFNLVRTEVFASKTECRKRDLFIKNNHAAKQALIDQINKALSSNG